GPGGCVRRTTDCDAQGRCCERIALRTRDPRRRPYVGSAIPEPIPADRVLPARHPPRRFCGREQEAHGDREDERAVAPASRSLRGGALDGSPGPAQAAWTAPVCRSRHATRFRPVLGGVAAIGFAKAGRRAGTTVT